MRLSIIIPVYNEELYLRRCLNSIKIQEGVEVIAIDDASTDRSRDIMMEYPRICPCANDRNRGVAHTRNMGIIAADGDYITFLDADDALTPDGIENMLKAIEANPDADVIQLNHFRCHEAGCKIEGRYSARNGFRPVNDLPPKWAPVWNKLYRMQFLLEHEIRFPEGQQFDEDRIFNIQCLKYTGGIQCDSRVALCKYFDNDMSLCHTVDKEKMSRAIQKLAEMLGEDNSPKVNEVIRQSIIMHLSSKKYTQVFGG